MKNQPIVIMGFMGTGKTTVAHWLARQLKCPALDLDHLIAEGEGRGPKEIIEEDGEEAFRRIETKILREVLVGSSSLVLAVGGGAWTIAENRALITKQGSLSVWLDAPFDLCWKRIEAGREARPLASSREVAQKLYDERLPIYALAETRIPVAEDESAEEIAAKVARLIERRGRS